MMMFPISCKGPNTKKEKICMVTSCPAFILSLKISHIRMNRITWRRVFTKVPCIKLMLRMRFTLVSSSARIWYVFLFSLFTSSPVSPRLFTSSIFLRDSVVDPAKQYVDEVVEKPFRVFPHLLQYAQGFPAPLILKIFVRELHGMLEPVRKHPGAEFLYHHIHEIVLEIFSEPAHHGNGNGQHQ